MAMTTTSCPAGNKALLRRKNSLISRLILFLLTAFPVFLVTVIPSLLIPLRINACDSCKVLRTSPHPLLVNGSISAVISYPFQFPVRLFFHAYRPSSEVLKSRNYTAKRFLPLALLRLKTCLPDLEAIRTRKPWVLFLLVFVLLVKVFFIVNPLKVIRSFVNHSSIYLSRLNW